MSLFYKYDLNNDGYLNWNQFFAFASQTPELWDTLYISRINMLNTFFPHEGYKIILNRRKNIKKIKQHQNYNGGSFPREPCFEFIKRLIKCKPNPYRYDYDCEIEQVSFVQIIKRVVKKYNSNFKFNKQAFAMKFLGAFNSYPVIYDIDRYYVIFRNYLPRKMSLQYTNKDSTMLSDSSSYGNGGHSDLMNALNQNPNTSKKSILRSSTRASQARESISAQHLSLYTTPNCKRKSNVLVNIVISPTALNTKSNNTLTVDISKDDEFY